MQRSDCKWMVSETERRGVLEVFAKCSVLDGISGVSRMTNSFIE